MAKQPQKCLIVGPSWVGDMMMAQSLFIKLKQDYPMMNIDVLAPAWSEPLLALMPEVRDSIVMPLGHGKLGLKKRYQLGKSLRNKGYDWSIVLPNSLKSALVPYSAKIPLRTGYKGEMRYGLLNDLRQLDKEALTMTVQRFVALGYRHYSPYPSYPPHSQIAPDYDYPSIQVKEYVKQIREKFSLVSDKPIIAFCPGAEYGSAKRWPEKHYAQLAELMVVRDYQIIILGSKKDQVVASHIIKKIKLINTGSLVDLTGKTNLREVIALLQVATVVVSNDSGLMHIAAAVNTPLIALYGSSDPLFTPPLSNNNEILSLGLSCSPCFKRECPLGTLACLQGITPEVVENKLLCLL